MSNDSPRCWRGGTFENGEEEERKVAFLSFRLTSPAFGESMGLELQSYRELGSSCLILFLASLYLISLILVASDFEQRSSC